MLYTDASFDRNLGGGVGACTLMNEGIDEPRILTRIFEVGSCAALELATVLWALALFEVKHVEQTPVALTIYTDSKTVVELPRRREKLIECQFTSRRTGLKLSNSEEYKLFFEILARLQLRCDVQIKWMKGHTPKSLRTPDQVVFSEVDRVAREALRKLRLEAKIGDPQEF